MAGTGSKTDKILTLGTDEPSLLFAINELVSSGGIDFDEWWKEYRKGFATQKKATPQTRSDDWTKPKYVDVVSKKIGGCRVIRFFPDESDIATSYLLSGTDRDLVSHITAIGYQQSGGGGIVSGKNSKPPLKGFPLIELGFVSPEGKVGIKWMRCVGYTDDSRVAATKLVKLVTRADIKGWATKIKTVFGDTKYVWKKGKECLSYSGQIARLQGFEGYAYVKGKEDGVNLFTAMLKVFDAVPDKEGFNKSESTSSTKYKKAPQEITVADSKTTLDERRPLVDCEFDYAVLKLPLLKKSIPLVKRNVVLYK